MLAGLIGGFWVGVIGAWVLCGLLTYGFAFAFFCGNYPLLDRPEDIAVNRRYAFVLALLGPFGLGVTVTQNGIKHGWRLTQRNARDAGIHRAR